MIHLCSFDLWATRKLMKLQCLQLYTLNITTQFNLPINDVDCCSGSRFIKFWIEAFIFSYCTYLFGSKSFEIQGIFTIIARDTRNHSPSKSRRFHCDVIGSCIEQISHKRTKFNSLEAEITCSKANIFVN